MDFRQLESFVSITKHKSFSKAAEELFITQPTISSHIQNLEKELDTILINRSSKEVTLTRAGELFLKYALSILDTKNQIVYKLSNYKGTIEGCLEINCSTMPQQYLLPKILCQYNKIYPHVTFDLKQSNSQSLIDSILNNSVEFGIIGAKIDNTQLEYVELMEDILVVISPLDLKIPDLEGKISINSLLNKNLIMRNLGSGTRRIFENNLSNHNLDLKNFNVLAQSESTEAIKNMVIEGIGISVLSYRDVKEIVELKKVNCYYIQEFDMKRSFYFVNHKYKVLSPLASSFKEFLLEKVGAI
jgi:LysR family transcriptional regulator, transcriptional activator of the cysJI operon